MANKYCYAILHKETGKMLLEDHKLPIYWNKKVAQERVALFKGYCLQPIELENIEWFLLHPYKP